jgi:NAD(P)-dependent dehydrogenase (short-subunit alcohol dehydrogenase family)
MSERVGRLQGRTVLITGAARGVGREIALAMAREGASIALLDRCAPLFSTPYVASSRDDLEATAGEVTKQGVQALAIEADVTRYAELEAAVRQTEEELGPIEVLVPNAGIFTWARLWEITEEQWDETMNINLKGAWLTMKAALPAMIERRRGRVIAVASTAGLRGGADISHYVASKHGLVGLIRSLAMEVGQYGITADALCPSRMRTTMVTFPEYYERLAGPGATEEDLARVSRAELVMPIDFMPVTAVAEAAVWLASDAAAYITGTAIPVDAGEMLV